MVISNINTEPTQSVIPFGTFSGSSNSAVTSVISNNKPSNEKLKMLKTPKLLINNVVNGQSALKSVKKPLKTPQPKTLNQFRPSLSSLGTPEFDHAPKSPPSRSDFDFSQLRGAGIGSETPFARRMPCVFEPEKPLPPIFSIFD